MKVSEFKIEYGRTIRPADFESKTCRMEVHVVLDDGEDAKKIADVMLKRIQEKVEATLKPKPAPEQVEGGKFEV